jgi:LmbE family N-acetylglucosaminyl deacetylase/protein-L-isoaspartate O-methyltransferase
VVTFDSTLPGTSAAAWRADDRFAALPPLDLVGVDRLVVVAAHPDDETLGAGALIAESARRGIRISVLIVTDGAASHPGSTSTTSDDLRTRRAGEAVDALRLLAPDAGLRLLDLPDGAVLENRAAVADAVAAVLDEAEGSVLLASTWRGDGHRDHRIVGEVCAELAAARATRFVEYPVWLWHWATPHDADVPWADFVALSPGADVLAAKAAAIDAHDSQVRALSGLPGDEAVLRPDFVEHFHGAHEVYIEQGPALDSAYFDGLYTRHDDPWGFTDRWYEQRKRAVTLASLPDARYGSVLEIGCSIGVLTAEIAARSDRLLAVDVSEIAVARARERLSGQGHVAIETVDVASAFPAGPFDLIVVSEVGYYFSRAVLERVIDDAVEALAPGGTLLACHWRHPVVDYTMTGDAVHNTIAERVRMPRLAHHDEEDFRLDVYSADGRSVASRTGLH